MQPARDLSTVQSDGAKRGDAARSSRLDRRPSRHRHREPVPADRAPRSSLPHRPDQQRLRLSRCRSGRDRVKAGRISEAMFLAAARTIAELSPAKHDPRANCCRRLRSCERFRCRWRSRLRGRPRLRGSRPQFRMRISSPPSERKCGSRSMRYIGGCRWRNADSAQSRHCAPPPNLKLPGNDCSRPRPGPRSVRSTDIPRAMSTSMAALNSDSGQVECCYGAGTQTQADGRGPPCVAEPSMP